MFHAVRDKIATTAAQISNELSVAVVIASKNRPADILRCLESIAQQPTKPDEIIIVDQSMRKYDLPPVPNLVHIYDVRINGAASARNQGVLVSQSDVILFLDDDCEFLSDCVAELRKAFRARPGAIGVQCNTVGDKGVMVSTFHRLGVFIFDRGFFNSAPIHRKSGVELRNANGVAAYYRRLFNTELFDESLAGYSLGEDWEFSRRARKYGRIWLAERASIFHHCSPLNRIDRRQFAVLRWLNMLYFYDKLRAYHFVPNRWWRIWWKVGQAVRWLRLGLGFPSDAKARATLKVGAHRVQDQR